MFANTSLNGTRTQRLERRLASAPPEASTRLVISSNATSSSPKWLGNGKSGERRAPSRMADAQPHFIWPDGVKFDGCIERIGFGRSHQHYPVGLEWPGDHDSWHIWQGFIKGLYAPKEDIFRVKSVKDSV